jgi:hypothetical protein
MRHHSRTGQARQTALARPINAAAPGASSSTTNQAGSTAGWAQAARVIHPLADRHAPASRWAPGHGSTSAVGGAWAGVVMLPYPACGRRHGWGWSRLRIGSVEGR